MKHLLNQLKSTAQQATQGRANTRHGTVSSYDPGAYAVKVMLQPDNVETGWLPLKSIFIGNGWGIFCPPSIGDAVEIDYQEGDNEVGSIGMRFFNDQDRPLPCPSGEFWLVHKSGASVKSTNDGMLTLSDPSGTVLQLSNDGNVRITGNLIVSGNTTTKGNTETDGATLSKGAITGQGGMAVSGGSGATVAGNLAVSGGDVSADSISLKNHLTTGVQPGSGTSGKPQ
jgi:phage baseplate assembly protein gpV